MTLVKTADLEEIRLLLLAGKEDPIHTVPGEITGQSLEGRVALTAEPKATHKRILGGVVLPCLRRTALPEDTRMLFAGGAYLDGLGITSQLFPGENAPNGNNILLVNSLNASADGFPSAYPQRRPISRSMFKT
jgi:hypothetical protein